MEDETVRLRRIIELVVRVAVGAIYAARISAGGRIMDLEVGGGGMSTGHGTRR